MPQTLPPTPIDDAHAFLERNPDFSRRNPEAYDALIALIGYGYRMERIAKLDNASLSADAA